MLPQYNFRLFVHKILTQSGLAQGGFMPQDRALAMATFFFFLHAPFARKSQIMILDLLETDFCLNGLGYQFRSRIAWEMKLSWFGIHLDNLYLIVWGQSYYSRNDDRTTAKWRQNSVRTAAERWRNNGRGSRVSAIAAQGIFTTSLAQSSAATNWAQCSAATNSAQGSVTTNLAQLGQERLQLFERVAEIDFERFSPHSWTYLDRSFDNC